MRLPVIACLAILVSCNGKNSTPDTIALAKMDLKRGEVVVCGPPDKQFGTVDFASSCAGAAKKDFNLAMALLHSFEYDEAEKVFAKVIDAAPGCPMAYWGVAMSNFHPLWAAPTQDELEKGEKAIAIAQSLKPSGPSSDYIDAVAAFYHDWNKIDHRSRTVRFEKAMEQVQAKYPDDKDAALFYALALTAAADPTDKTFTKQKKAGSILNALYPGQPDHPGVVHYIIHAYDSPELAPMALEAAKKYASVAPSSAHALHMPSHIFTRLGMWQESIQSNLASVASAQCYAEQTGIKGHWDEEIHGLDYLMYAYLQKGETSHAREQWDHLKAIEKVSPVSFKVAYAFASIPCRYVIENHLWNEAAALSLQNKVVNWEKSPWPKAMLHFTRALGMVHTGKTDAARNELKQMQSCYDTLVKQKDAYRAAQVQIQLKTAEAWILMKEGKKENALQLMKEAADMEDRTAKLPVTPGEITPAREFLGDMLLQFQQPADALVAYEIAMKNQPKRFNCLYHAAVAAEQSGNSSKAKAYYQQLLAVASSPAADRPELQMAKDWLAKH